MQINYLKAIIISSALWFLIVACTPSSYYKPTHKAINENNFQLEEITLTYLRKTTRFPIHTRIQLMNYAFPQMSYVHKIIVPPHRIEEVKKAWGNYAFYKIEKSWQSDLQNHDFIHIEKMCNKLNLFTQTQIDVPTGTRFKKPCIKINQIKFSLTSKTGQENTFMISGAALCQPNAIPARLKQFISEIEALIPKYQPRPETQLANNI
ncbi:MAG: hypothetical protein VSS75_033565 [Candidatus Parabeggiatoa sp.]|nr:hypothetical protein [Candidatus Parabeggiatoa sp.]